MHENLNQHSEVHSTSNEAPKACHSAGKNEGSVWERSMESAAKAWDKTKEVSGDVWESTKEVSAKAWDKTKEFGSDISEKFSGEKKSSSDIYEFDETDEFDIEEPMSDYEDEELRAFHASHHQEKNKSYGTHHNIEH